MKQFKPTTPGRRQMSTVSYREVLTARGPLKSLTRGRQRFVGRASSGRISVRHKGGGHKRLWREIDFRYDKIGIPARVQSTEYDPNRSGFVALVIYADGERRYVLAPRSVKPGDSMLAAPDAPLKPGNRLPLKNISVGTFVYNIEFQPGGGARLVRSAGSFAEVLAHESGYASLKLPSTEIRRVPEGAWASIGEVSNPEHNLEVAGKAGRSRWKGIRPTVRGSAMNPVDHPHGGGEGRMGIGLRLGPKTPWGKQALGVRTRKSKKYSDSLIISRRQKKKRK